MANSPTSRDWLRSPRSSAFAWLLPVAGLLVGLFVPVPERAAIWIVALAWMGVACILNARRCGRTHCRYTGPYFLAMIVPVLLLCFDVLSFGTYGWFALGVVILLGGVLLWWGTERAWGRYSFKDAQ